MNVGSLFTGIGGFDLGLERAGMRVVWQCESSEYRRGVLALRWPGVPCYSDVRGLDAAAVEPVDVVCGGFPCIDISSLGGRAGIEGPSSGLWAEMLRVVSGLRPRYVLVENVSDLVVRGLGRVLGDLAALGYDAEWDCLRAADFGAPHRRNRVWLVAYPQVVGDANGTSADPHASSCRQRDSTCESGWWAPEPRVGRVANGLPGQVDRLSALGDSLVPQIAEWIGGRVMAYENALAEAA